MLLPSGLMNKVAMVKEMENIYRTVHGLQLTKAYLALAMVETNLPIAESNRAPKTTPFTEVMIQLPGGRLNALNHFHHGSNSILLLL